MHDYTEYQDDTTSDSAMAEIAKLADRQRAAEKAVALAEHDLKVAQRELRTVKEQLLPEALERHGLSGAKTGDGLDIEIKEEIKVSLPVKDPERYMAGMSWFRAHGYERLIESTVIAAFDVGAEGVEAAAEALEEAGARVKLKEGVHPSRIQSVVSKAIEEGEDVPLDIFNAFRRKYAVIK